MPQQPDTYSKGVKIAKYVLPLIAIALFVSIFAQSNNDAIRSGEILTTSEMQDLAVNQKITKPRFAGLTRSGDAFTLEADEALPDAPQPNRLDLVGPRMEVDTTGGIGFKAHAVSGSVNFQEQSAQLEGTVTFETTNGYTAFSDKIRIDLKAGRAVSPGPVRAEGPAGSITAGAMQATQSDESNVQSPEGRIEFWGGVRLIYLPSASKSAK
jgi:lipopolysaccharide export system protein LptC